MSAKYCGIYTNGVAKSLKGSEKIICRVYDDGNTIFVCNGYVAYKMTPDDYAAAVQPVTHCDPGDWSIFKDGRREPSDLDIQKIFNDGAKAVQDAEPMKHCPLDLEPVKKGAVSQMCFYNENKDFSAFYNAVYLSSFTGCTLRAASASSPAIAYWNDEPAALVMPIRPNPAAARAVKAYFADSDTRPAGNVSADLDRARLELDSAEAVISDLNKKLEEITAARDAAELHAAELAAELEKLHNAAPVVESKPEPKTAAELIAVRFADMAGVTTTINGAQTAAPVVWLTGDTEKHADAIKAAGAKWSSKKRAYYVRVA